MKARLQSGMMGALLVVQLCWVGTAAAQLPIPASSQFDMTGLLQEASVTNVADPRSGGSLTVNGIKVRVPSNTIVILPANALTWQEIFAQAPLPYGPTAAPPSSGLALADLPQPLTTYEVQVVGNRVIGATDEYVAGLIYVSKEFLNSGAGFISFIDYTLGELRVGGILNDPACAQGGTFLTNPLCSGTRVRINDPVNAAIGTGRYSFGQTPDQRFTVDQDNPTIMSGTAYPMCLPRVAPPSVDPLCPEGNRPRDLAGNPVPSITMPDPSLVAPGQLPDPRIQAPFEVGDYITFSGTLVSDLALPLVGPYSTTVGGPGTGDTYVSAHTIINNVAIYTFPGTNPAYVETEVFILGTGGLTVIGAGEAAIRSRFEGMTTDPSRNINLYGIDVDPVTGATTDRYWGTIGVDQGPPLGAVKGRWRFRPPCLPFGSVPTKPDKECVMNASGTFLPPPREMRAVIAGLEGQNPASPTAVTAANGIFYGQYHAPILEYIFPENIPGTPIVENNFNTIDFLACGGYTSSAGTLAAQLNPWPSNIVPVCANAPQPPVANAGAAQTVASGALVTLSGSATGTTPITFAWTQTGGPAVVLSNAALANPTFTAPIVGTATVLTFQLTATNSLGSSSATTTVTVNATGAPTVAHIAAQTVGSGTPVTLQTTATDPAGLPVTFQWLQTAGTPVVFAPNPAVGPTVASGAAASSPSFTVVLPIGAPGVTLQFQVTATNSAGVVSAPEFTSVTVNPLADSVIITSAEYRIGKQRLIVNATSSVVSPGVVLTLAPYLTTSGTTFDPTSLGNVFTNNGGGLYILTLVGAPKPACNGNPADTTNFATPCSLPVIAVKSNLGGSATSPLTKIRQ